MRIHIFCAAVLIAIAGCSPVRVRVDARVAPEAELRDRLSGPAYVIRGPDEQAEASLAFQEFAATWAHALEMRFPELRRVGPAEPAEFAVLLHASVADLGGGVESYPVYGSHYGRAIGPCGPMYFHSYGVVGAEVHAVHYGYDHSLFVTAYIQDPAGPGGRRVIWEARAATVDEANDISAAMPYLALGLASHFGAATDGTERVKFSRRDHEVRFLRQWVRTGMRPATRPAEEED